MNQQQLDLNNEVEETEAPEGFERAMPFEIEQRAALYGLGKGLLALGNTPNKKNVKKLVKRLRIEVINELGSKGGQEILDGNEAGVMNIVNSINNTQVDRHAKRLLKRSTVEEFVKSFNIGTQKLYG